MIDHSGEPGIPWLAVFLWIGRDHGFLAQWQHP
jgi:hypothetical protein